MRQWFSDFGEFAGAVLRHWVQLMTGGIIIAVLTVYKDALGHTLTTTFNTGLAIVFLGLAALGAWREQKAKVRELRAGNDNRVIYESLITSLTDVVQKGHELETFCFAENYAPEQAILEWEQDAKNALNCPLLGTSYVVRLNDAQGAPTAFAGRQMEFSTSVNYLKAKVTVLTRFIEELQSHVRQLQTRI